MLCLQAAPGVLAVGYACRDARQQGEGHFTLWILKDPLRPVNVISTPAGVTSIAWSKRTPIHVAVGLRSGIMAIYDARQQQANTLSPSGQVLHSWLYLPLLTVSHSAPCNARVPKGHCPCCSWSLKLRCCRDQSVSLGQDSRHKRSRASRGSQSCNRGMLRERTAGQCGSWSGWTGAMLRRRCWCLPLPTGASASGLPARRGPDLCILLSATLTLGVQPEMPSPPQPPPEMWYVMTSALVSAGPEEHRHHAAEASQT